MIHLPKKGPIFWSLSKLIAGFILLLLAVISVAFIYWLNQGVQQEIVSIDRDLNRTLLDTRRLLVWRSLEQLQNSAEKAKPLHPIRFESHPSPFSYRDLDKFKRQYPLQTYYAQHDVSAIVETLVGYSNVTLSSGTKGDQYLSILAWVKPTKLKLYEGTQASRQASNHLWFLYHDNSGKLQSVLISLQALESADLIEVPGARIAEISGFLAPKPGVASSLRLDSTIKGSLFKAHDGDGYVLSFRMRVKSLLKVPRPRIDVTRSVGVQFNIGGDQQASISTFTLKDNTLNDVPHLSGSSIKQAMKVLPSEIHSIALMNQKTEVASLLSRRYTPYNASSVIERLLWLGIKHLVNDQLGVIQTDSDSFLLYQDELLQQLSTDQVPVTLRVQFDPQERLKKLIATQKTQILLYLAVVFIVITILLAIHFYIVRRIVLLTEALARFEAGDSNALKPNLQQVNDEIGLLAHFLDRTIQSFESSRLQTEEFYVRRAKLMAIMGHDIRTPVAALLSLHKENRETLNYVKKIERASTVILEVAKLDDSLLPRKNFETIDAREFFQAVTDELRKKFSGIVNFEPPEQPVLIHTNEEMLEDAIDGIIDNAVDYAKTITIRISSNANFGLMEICNDGKPIDESIMNTLFDYGVSNRTNCNNKHFGIGLFSVAFRMRILKGEISVINQQNGVVFKLQLPLAGPDKLT